MKDKDDLALDAVFVCTAEPAAADWLPPASLTLRLKTCRVPLSLHTANHRRFGDSAMLWMSAWSRPLRTCKFRRCHHRLLSTPLSKKNGCNLRHLLQTSPVRGAEHHDEGALHAGRGQHGPVRGHRHARDLRAVRRDEPRRRLLLAQVLDADLPARRPGAGQHAGAGVAGEAAEPARVEHRRDLPERPRQVAQLVDPDPDPDGADGGADAGDVSDALVLAVVPELDPVPPGLARGDQREDDAAEQHLNDGVPAAAAGEDAAQALLERGAVEDAEVGGRRRGEAAAVLVPGDGEQPEAGVVGVDSTGGRGYGGVGHGLLPAVVATGTS